MTKYRNIDEPNYRLYSDKVSAYNVIHIYKADKTGHNYVHIVPADKLSFDADPST